eukprot:8611189-Pyramimonas_sp.AAC.1
MGRVVSVALSAIAYTILIFIYEPLFLSCYFHAPCALAPCHAFTFTPLKRAGNAIRVQNLFAPSSAPCPRNFRDYDLTRWRATGAPVTTRLIGNVKSGYDVRTRTSGSVLAPLEFL